MENVLINKDYLNKAKELVPKLNVTEFKDYIILENIDPNAMFTPKNHIEFNDISRMCFSHGSSVIIDFSDHHVGYFEFKPVLKSGIFDAPLFLKISFGESLYDFKEDFTTYKGWLSAGWIQQEYIHIDKPGDIIKLPRRYAFRYVKIEVLGISENYSCGFEDLKIYSVSSADMSKLIKVELPEDLKRIDDVSVKTMKGCMQSVFEDGPKRDQRLWLGDLRLQSLVNYFTFNNIDLFKRCLYLFSGIRRKDGAVFACLNRIVEQETENIYLADYSLLYISCVYDYYCYTEDKALVEELFPICIRQAEIVMENVGKNGLIQDKPGEWWSFIDWQKDLNKQAPTQGVLVYALKQLKKLAEILSDSEKIIMINDWIELTTKAALSLWNEDNDLFELNNKAACASQIWLVLADVLPDEKNRKILQNVLEKKMYEEIKTPYLVHYLIQAMYENSMKNEGLSFIKDYWGAMLETDTDCFWEAYDKNNSGFSPYNGISVNSYCHAWSCTPSYFIRKEYVKK